VQRLVSPWLLQDSRGQRRRYEQSPRSGFAIWSFRA